MPLFYDCPLFFKYYYYAFMITIETNSMFVEAKTSNLNIIDNFS